MKEPQARLLLQQMLGANAQFRSGQWNAIDLVANQKRRVLVVQRTGWGKSIVYFLATKILRDSGAGPTLLVSPLLSLMRNQIAAAAKLGLRAITIHSQNAGDWPQAESALRNNHCDLLLISPERLGNEEFTTNLLPLFQGNVSLFVVDEAHCISDWGHDFRPDYRRIVRILRLLPQRVPVLCTTATANDRVVEDIQNHIPNLEISRGPLVRPSLRLFTIRLDDQAERLAWLSEFVPRLPGSGIIYTLTIDDARRVAAWLQRSGIDARCYHADLDNEVRIECEQLLVGNQVKALVATVALGMGFDKPDLGFVIHYQRPGSVIAYYQQVGRAGRALETAYGILLNGREDDEIQDYFIRTAFPPVEVMEGVLKALERVAHSSIDDIGAQINAGRGMIEKALRLLEVDGAVQHTKSTWRRTPNPWTPDRARYARVTQHRADELAEMQRYVHHAGCLMEFLARALDDPTAAPCHRCMNCTHSLERHSPRAGVVSKAVNFLRGDSLVIEPHTRWPRPALSDVQAVLPSAISNSEKNKPTTMIPSPLTAEPGRMLCVYGDAGWGPEVTRGKYRTGEFSEELIEAVARLVEGEWMPDPRPAWICPIPSLKHPALVSGFAERLANRMHLEFHAVLRKVKETPPQKQMHNSVQQVRNLLGAFEVRGNVPPQPVLLVDDIADSRWTLTLAAVVLRQHGSGSVYPFALAKASPRGS